MKSCISNIFFDYGDAPLTLFLRLRNFLNNRKSLMTLMTVTLMTGKRPPKHLFIFLVKLLPCLSHCFRSPIVGLYQQWALVILHNLDSD